jgi:hypothetical protein
MEEVPRDRLDAADFGVVEDPIVVVEMKVVVERVGEDERAPARDQKQREAGWEVRT